MLARPQLENVLSTLTEWMSYLLEYITWDCSPAVCPYYVFFDSFFRAFRDAGCSMADRLCCVTREIYGAMFLSLARYCCQS